MSKRQEDLRATRRTRSKFLPGRFAVLYKERYNSPSQQKPQDANSPLLEMFPDDAIRDLEITGRWIGDNNAYTRHVAYVADYGRRPPIATLSYNLISTRDCGLNF